MKRSRLVLIVFVVAVIVAASVYYSMRIGNAAKEYQQRLMLPDFHFSQFNGLPFVRDSLPAAQPMVLVLFDPDCEHCLAELDLIESSLPAFVGTELLLVSPADRSRVIPFTKGRGLDTLPHVRVLLTEAKDFEASFGSVKTPSTFFYAADGSLRKDFYGKLKPEGLRQGLEALKE